MGKCCWCGRPRFPADAQPGDTISVELRSEGCPGMNAAQFTLGFDTSVLDCTACETGPALTPLAGDDLVPLCASMQS